MAAQIQGIFDEDTRKAVLDSKLLVVGAGGIGCELLKNLALMGFADIHLIDLDTIDVSNLNRQFLFQKEHVGRPKAVVAKESAQKLNPKCNITTYHDSITSMKYNVSFFEQFAAVANALDNMAARRHVNRMCIAANVPLVESGSAGYLGQVTVHKKELYECFECIPKARAKTFPTCTIRNTPSETIHCVVWAKHLFNQLFGEDDPDQDVSPDPTDLPPDVKPSSVEDKGAAGDASNNNNKDQAKRLPTRALAKQFEYDGSILFRKFFHDDIEYLLEMTNLWEKRRAPVPLVLEDLPDAVAGGSSQPKSTTKDQELWSLKDCADVFKESLAALKKRSEVGGGDGILTWDKDEKFCMDFVAACTNLRAQCFGITQESRFKIKSMAGNIVPAIATTNAIVGGLIAIQLMNVLKGKLDKCRAVYLNANATATRNRLVSSCQLQEANPKCYVCSNKTPEVIIKLHVCSVTVKTLLKLLTERLNMVAPDVMIDDGKGTILISSDSDDSADVADKTLGEFGIESGCRLQCDDFFQQFSLILRIIHDYDMEDQDFEIEGDLASLIPKEEVPEEEKKDSADDVEPSSKEDISDDEEIVMIGQEIYTPLKRKIEDDNGLLPTKRLKTASSSEVILL